MLLLSMGCKLYGYALDPVGSPNLFNLLNFSGLGRSSYGNTKFTIDPAEFVHRQGDINDMHALSSFVNEVSPDICIHLAAQPLVRKSYESPIETWTTNVIGTLNLLESVRRNQRKCVIVVVTTDKVYKNKEWDFGYRENDQLGGLDPYSASKSAVEIAVSSWSDSFAFRDNYSIAVCTARAGNVIGGGDWSADRIVPDSIRALQDNLPIQIRNPLSTRPWQHVLEPLSGYLLLAEKLYCDRQNYLSGFNFGPSIDSNKSVLCLVKEMLIHWEGAFEQISESNPPHEAKKLHLNIDKAFHQLGWKPIWDFPETVEKTICWYKRFSEGVHPIQLVRDDINSYLKACNS